MEETLSFGGICGVLVDKYIWHRVVYDSCIISIQAKLYEVVNGFD
jgi:hypothetical protein